ncbi:MAG: hypothetical protein ACTSRA_12930 [Promethearchaeota archaeon]
MKDDKEYNDTAAMNMDDENAEDINRENEYRKKKVCCIIIIIIILMLSAGIISLTPFFSF